MVAVTKTVFIDLPERDRKALHALEAELARLRRLKHPTLAEKQEQNRIEDILRHLGRLPEPIDSLKQELARLRLSKGKAKDSEKRIRELEEEIAFREAGGAPAAIVSDEAGVPVVDPLFIAVRDEFNRSNLLSRTMDDHDAGVLTGLDVAGVVRASHVTGIMARDAATAPRVVAVGDRLVADTTDPAYGAFMSAFYAAVGIERGSFELAELVLPILHDEGDRDGAGGARGEVLTTEFAAVMRALAADGVTAREQQLRRRVNQALDRLQKVNQEPEVADLSISLPDLSSVTQYDIQRSNVEAIGPIIFAAMFDELKAFDVVDKLVEQSQQGLLPIGHGDAGRRLYEYWKSAPNRMSEAERRNFYAMTIGIPGGAVNGQSNRDFNDLWIRFTSSVSSLVRQGGADKLLTTRIPYSVSQQQVRKAARDLALNLSLHGYGMVHYAARDLQDQIMGMINLLGHPEIMGSYGARDMWQVIDQVASLELGGARNSARYRTLATCGAIITMWLAQNVERFNSATSVRPVIDLNDVLSSEPRSAGAEATKHPTDYDMVNACELWNADTALSGDRVEELSEPREAPQMTSRPVAIPSIARDILDQALPPGMGFGMGASRR